MQSNKQNCRNINTVIGRQQITLLTKIQRYPVCPDMYELYTLTKLHKIRYCCRENWIHQKKNTDSYIGNPRLDVLQKYNNNNNNNWADYFEVYYELPFIILAVYRLYFF